MRVIRRVNVLILLVVLSLAFSQIRVQAQGSCFTGLKPADCQLITDSSPSLAKLTTFVMNYTFNARASGLPGGTVSMSAQGSGPLDLTRLDRTDIITVFSSPVFSNTITGSLAIGNRQLSGTLDLRLVDGIFYLRDNPLSKNVWMKFSMDKVLRASYSRSGQSTVFPASANLDFSQITDKYKAIGLFDFTKASSKPGAAVEGQPTTQIILTYDIEGYIKFMLAPENRDMLRKVLGGNSAATITETQLEQAAALLPAYDSILKNTKFSLIWIIGTKDKMFHGEGVNFSTLVDAQTAATLEGQQTAQALSISGNFQVTISKIGQPVKVVAVDPAYDITDLLLNPSTTTGTPLMP